MDKLDTKKYDMIKVSDKIQDLVGYGTEYLTTGDGDVLMIFVDGMCANRALGLTADPEAETLGIGAA